MIIDNGYFKGKIYIPHAKPGITDTVTGVSNDIIDFINEYSEDCLIECLGLQLFKDLLLNLDENEETWVDPLSDQKWDELVNGKEYVDPSTQLNVEWRGIRYESKRNSGIYDKSFLADYTYFFYEKKEYITRSGIGHAINEADNAVTQVPTQAVVNAWNNFVTLVQGNKICEKIIYSEKGYGVDFFVEDNVVSLYKFINDSNKINEETYSNFKPKIWERMTEFGI
jgi:hypothetical protein